MLRFTQSYMILWYCTTWVLKINYINAHFIAWIQTFDYKVKLVWALSNGFLLSKKQSPSRSFSFVKTRGNVHVFHQSCMNFHSKGCYFWSFSIHWNSWKNIKRILFVTFSIFYWSNFSPLCNPMMIRKFYLLRFRLFPLNSEFLHIYQTFWEAYLWVLYISHYSILKCLSMINGIKGSWKVTFAFEYVKLDQYIVRNLTISY